MTWEQEVQISYNNGVDDGIKQAKIETAKKMIESGKFSLEDISTFTSLTIEEIKNLTVYKQESKK